MVINHCIFYFTSVWFDSNNSPCIAIINNVYETWIVWMQVCNRYFSDGNILFCVTYDNAFNL